jgi:hypothetical protein
VSEEPIPSNAAGEALDIAAVTRSSAQPALW